MMPPNTAHGGSCRHQSCWLAAREEREREMAEGDRPLQPTTVEVTGEVAAIALSAVPVAGGPLSGIASAVIAKRQNRRLNQFLMDLAADLKDLDDRLNSDFLRTEEFEDLAEDVFSKAAEARQQEKLDALRAVFLNAAIAPVPSYDEVEEITNLIQAWQTRHIVLLRILADPLAADERMNNAVGSGGGFSTSISAILQELLPEWDDDQVDRAWQDLYDAKILRTPGTKAMLTDQGINQLQNRLTDFGVKVARFLTFPE